MARARSGGRRGRHTGATRIGPGARLRGEGACDPPSWNCLWPSRPGCVCPSMRASPWPWGGLGPAGRLRLRFSLPGPWSISSTVLILWGAMKRKVSRGDSLVGGCLRFPTGENGTSSREASISSCPRGMCSSRVLLSRECGNGLPTDSLREGRIRGSPVAGVPPQEHRRATGNEQRKTDAFSP